MSILGKVLIVLNLLAAGAFAYFTLENRKIRKDLTRMAVIRDIQLNGLPVETPAVPPADLDKDYAAFKREVNGLPYESIPKDTIKGALPAGGETLGAGGGDPVITQTDEVKRVQAKVFDNIQKAAGQDPNLRYQWLRAYALAVARTGAERDGVNAVFDMRDPSRVYAARRDLPLAARTESQTAALRALVGVTDLGDPQAIAEAYRPTRIAQAREAVRRFALGEVPNGVGGTGDTAEAERKLKNAVLAATQERAGEAEKQAVIAAATDSKDFPHVAAAAVETLSDKQSTDRAAAALLAYATAKAVTPSEGKGLTALSSLIRPPAVNFNLDAEVDNAATNLLTAKFEDAALPAATKAAAGGNPAGEKARKIAHLLYHVDGWRYADKTPATVTDRQAWHGRVATVVGLPEYIRAAESEATEYAEASQRLTAVITEEQSAFEAEYHAQLQRILFLYSQWLAVDAQLKAQDVITKENVRLMNERKTERDNLLKELAQAREDAKATLAKLNKTQKDLFAIQKDLRDAQEALLVLEKQLRKLESDAQKYENQATRRD
jgi:hypothetical protein